MYSWSRIVGGVHRVDDSVSWRFEQNKKGQLVGVIYITVSKWNSDTLDTVRTAALHIKEALSEVDVESQDAGDNSCSAASQQDLSTC